MKNKDVRSSNSYAVGTSTRKKYHVGNAPTIVRELIFIEKSVHMEGVNIVCVGFLGKSSIILGTG